MVKFCFSGLNVHIFPSHGLELEINLSVQYLFVKHPRNRMCTEKNRAMHRDGSVHPEDSQYSFLRCHSEPWSLEFLG